MNYSNESEVECKAQLVVMEKFTARTLVTFSSDRKKLIFHDNCELVPAETGGWKIVDNGREISLLDNGHWVISFKNYDHIIITTSPYKKLTDVEWVILYDWTDAVSGCLCAYRAGEEDLVEYKIRKLDSKKKEVYKEWKIEIKKSNRAAKRARWFRDDDDDEDNIMRALGSGNGDIFGY